MSTRLAIVTTHPIQYLAPVFAELTKQANLQVRVFYGWHGGLEKTTDPGFGRSVQWDIPLLEGYDYEFVSNVAKDPGSDHFRGINLPDLIGKLLAWKSEAVLVYGWCYKSHLDVLRKLHGRIPILFRGDSTMLNPTTRWRGWARSNVLRWVYRHVDLAYYVGTRNRDYFLASGLTDDQLVFAPHAVDNARFQDTEAETTAAKWRESLGIQQEDVVFLLPAKLAPIKAPDLLLEAFKRIQATHAPRTHLVFAGSGPLEAALQERRIPNTHFLGFQNQSQMPAVYRLADLVVLPSLSETWGLALNEAMASGRAVLASDRVGAAIDLVHPGINGWIVTANQVDSLADALREARQLGRDGLAAFGQQSQQVISQWTIPIQASRIAEGLSNLLDR